jgi:hypothetical protein
MIIIIIDFFEFVCCGRAGGIKVETATPRMPKLRTPLSTPLKFPSATWL